MLKYLERDENGERQTKSQPQVTVIKLCQAGVPERQLAKKKKCMLMGYERFYSLHRDSQ